MGDVTDGIIAPGEWNVRCHATSKRSGEGCRNWAVKGALVCRMHGVGGHVEEDEVEGLHPQDPRKARAARVNELRDKLAQLGDEAVAAVQRVMHDPEAKPSEVLKAAELVLDRFVPKKAEVEVHDTEVRDLDEEIAEAITEQGRHDAAEAS